MVVARRTFTGPEPSGGRVPGCEVCGAGASPAAGVGPRRIHPGGAARAGHCSGGPCPGDRHVGGRGDEHNGAYMHMSQNCGTGACSDVECRLGLPCKRCGLH
jgi:hypothetical protein